MSESFQEFCKRILPVVQAGADGKKIEFLGDDSESWFKKDTLGFIGCCKYRVAEPKATPLPITTEMWAMIDPKYKYSCLNPSGVISLCKEEPEWWNGVWVLRGDLCDYCVAPLNIDTIGIIPELSLTKRPDNYVIDNDVDVGNVAALSFSIMGLPKHANVDATHYAKSIAGNHVDLYKRDPLNKEQWMTWDYQSSGWIKVQLFGAEPNPIK